MKDTCAKPFDFCEKTVLVTGGTSGIGRAIAEQFATFGARVVLVGTNETRGNRAVEEICQATPNSRVDFFACDVSSRDDVLRLSKDMLAQDAKLDTLVHCAGITRDALLMRMEESQWDDVINVNLKSCYYLTKSFVRPLIKSRGNIILISSIVGLMGNPGQANYAASKAGMIGMTKSLAKELGSKVRVNCVAPGFIKTPMTDRLTQEQQKAIESMIAMKRTGEPREVAHVVLFLASELASYITGQTLTVDGGIVF